MRNESDNVHRLQPSPSVSKISREWILASALYDGIEDEDIRQIETLLSERGANPNVLLFEYGITPFHLAVANDNVRFAVQATDICLQHGADPNVRSEEGLTPVHLAAMWGCSEVLRVLLASGGNPWLVDCFNKNAFHYAQVEGQKECTNILKMYCNSQPKPSSHSKSPYQLNLKRVIIYKNDLQIVYDASPTSSRKCTSTQTCQSSPYVLVSDTVEENIPNGQNKISTKGPRSNNINAVETKNGYSIKSKSQERIVNGLNKGTENSLNDFCHVEVSNRLKEIIVHHRKNSAVFEYPPCTEDNESFSSGVGSEKTEDIKSGIVSELFEKLELTNKIRQSLKFNENRSGMLRNITGRKKQDSAEHIVPVHLKGSPGDDSQTNSSHKKEIGFVLTDSNASSVFLSNPARNAATSNIESPPSIGFILDNLDGTQSRGSSLFSDIASDVEVFIPKKNNHENENIMTEDEISPGNRLFSKYSSSESLYPYVSCDNGNTRDGDLSEYFESCLENQQSSIETPIISPQTEMYKSETMLPGNSVNEDINSVLDSIINNLDPDQKTPVNPKLVSSTPERKSCGAKEPNSLSVAELNSNSEKRKWVEAKVSSSSDDDPYMSISEEYEYTDMDEGIVLIEKRYLLNDVSLSTTAKKNTVSNIALSSTSENSEISTVSGSDKAYETEELRRALHMYGFTPGPITGNTKRVYLRKLKRCRRKPSPPPQTGQPVYSPELIKTLDAKCEHLLYEWGHLEDSMTASFSCSRRPWREGQAKTSFTYLLLDPRITHNLPAFAHNVPHARLWADFLRAIFYVGKGKRSRPYAHLYKAVSVWEQQDTVNSKKIQYILDIWKSGQGVVCLHVFLNIIPVEAFTREAAMISALTLPQLTNEKAGEFYGSAACWSLRLKRRLGCVLLHRACKVFLAEGERQLRPVDIE